MGKQSLLGLRLSDEMWAMLDGLVAQQNEELTSMGMAARVGAQDVLRQLIHNAHVAGGVKALAGMIALGKKAPIVRPPPEPGPVDPEIDYNLEAAKEPEPTPKKGPRKKPEPPPAPKVEAPPTSSRAIDLTISSTPPPAPTVTSDEALAEIGLTEPEPVVPPEPPAPKTSIEDDEIAAMLDSV